MRTCCRSSVMLAVLLAPLLTRGQQVDFRRAHELSLLIQRDTLSVLAGQPFTLSDPEWDWRTAPTCTLIVYSREQQVQPAEQECSVRNRNDAGPKFRVHSRVRFDFSNTFTVLRILEGQGQDKRVYRYGEQWHVQVRWPSLYPLLDSEYWYGEAAVFSFAAGHEDLTAYSYDVETANRTLLSEQGWFVPIDRIWKSLAPENLNMTITIKGKYKGSTFFYQNPISKEVSESVWQFELKSPNRIEDVSLWMADSTFDELKAAGRLDLLPPIPMNLNPVNKYNPREFRFSSYAVKRLSFLMFMPEISDVSVASTPPDFLTGMSWRTDDPWRVLVIAPNLDYLQDRTARNPAEVSLTIRFRDQFGTSFRRTYKARVYAHQ